jgi:hypothetical protein
MPDPLKTIFAVAHVTPDDPIEDACRGCIFERDRPEVCTVAQEQAKLRGLDVCEHPDDDGRSVIYVRVAVDPRQCDLFNEQQGGI